MVGIKMEKRSVVMTILLLAWGGCCALVLVSPYLYTIGDGWIANFRAERLVDRYNDLLVYGQFDIAHNSHALGYGLYFPYLMRMLNIVDGKTIYCYVQAVSGMAVVFLYPVLVYSLYRNAAIGMASPILLHLAFGDMLYINKAGEYFSPLFALALGIPLLILMIRSNKEKDVIQYSIGIFAVAMLANIMRGQSAFPILLAWFITIIAKIKKKEIRLIPAAILFLACLLTVNLLGTNIPGWVAKLWGVEGKIAYNSSPWHSILIGMGYIDNPYGLYYSDDAGMNIVAKYYPEVRYNSAEYFEKCKEIAVKIFKENPLFVIKALAVKFLDSLKQNWECFSGAAGVTNRLYRMLGFAGCGLLAAALAFKKSLLAVARYNWKKFLLILCLIVISNYAGVLAAPGYYYNWGACGITGIIVLFAEFDLAACFLNKYVDCEGTRQ